MPHAAKSSIVPSFGDWDTPTGDRHRHLAAVTTPRLRVDDMAQDGPG